MFNFCIELICNCLCSCLCAVPVPTTTGVVDCWAIGCSCFIYHKISQCCNYTAQQLSNCCQWLGNGIKTVYECFHTKIIECNQFCHKQSDSCEGWVMSLGKPQPQNTNKIYSDDVVIEGVSNPNIINSGPPQVVMESNTNISTDLLGQPPSNEAYDNL